MTYEFTKFYVKVCDELNITPSEVDEALYIAISDCFEKGYTVESTVVEVEDDPQWETQVTDIQDVRDGDLVTITVPATTFGDSIFIGVNNALYDLSTGLQHPRVTFHHATRKRFQ